MEYIKEQFSKYLHNLKREIEQFQSDEEIWSVRGEILNSPGTLALHLCGNLKHNFGTVIGKNGFTRNRDVEFSARGVPKETILKDIENTEKMILPVIENLTNEDLMKPFEDSHNDEKQNVAEAIVRLALHFGYHIGQINYYRRSLVK